MRRAKDLQDDLGDGLQELINSAEALLEELRDAKDPAIETLRAKLRRTVKGATGRLQALKPDVSELTSQTLQHTMSFVKRDPWRALALGALAVVALGIIAHASGDED
jgi:ElaB/YqjD/DUF883 family membrane-anchored ribosome-binding protein